MVCRTDKESLSQCGQRGRIQFCADVFYGRPLIFLKWVWLECISALIDLAAILIAMLFVAVATVPENSYDGFVLFGTLLFQFLYLHLTKKINMYIFNLFCMLYDIKHLCNSRTVSFVCICKTGAARYRILVVSFPVGSTPSLSRASRFTFVGIMIVKI